MSNYWNSTGQSASEDQELDPRTGELKAKEWKPKQPPLEEQGINTQALQEGPQTEEQDKQSLLQGTPANEFDFGGVPVMPQDEETQVVNEEQVADPEDPSVLENYKAQELDAQLAGKKAQIEFDNDQAYGIRNDRGELVRDPDTGKVIRRDLTGFEKIDNSMQGMVQRVRQLIPNSQITVGALAQKLIPKPLLDDYADNGDASVLANMIPQGVGPSISNLAQWGLIPTKEDIQEAVVDKQMIQAEQGETGSIVEGIKEGDISEILAGVTNAGTSFLPSMVMAAMTGGTSTFTEFFGDSFVAYNEGVAEREGVSLQDLIQSDQASYTAPAAFAAINTISELVGLKGVGNAITKNLGKPLAKRAANIMLAGNKEGLTELFQTSMDAARDASAREGGQAAPEAFVNTMFSEDGLESYLQGFVGGSGFSGGGSVEKSDIDKLRKASAGMRAPIDTKKIEDALAKQVQLEEMINNTTDTQLQDNYRAQIADLNDMIKGETVHANGFAMRMTPKQLSEASNLHEAKAAMQAEQSDIIQKANKNEITREEKLAALQGLSARYKDINRKLQDIKDNVAEQPAVRDKDGSLKPKSAWSQIVAPKIESIAKNNLTPEGKITEEGAWKILESKEVKNVVNAAINKRFAAQGQEFDPVLAEDLQSELMYGGKQSIHGLLRTWDASKGASPASYIYGQIQNKLTGKLAKMEDQTGRGAVQIDKQADQGHGLQLESEPTLEDQTPSRTRTAVEVANDLGVAGPQLDAINQKMEVLAQTDKLPAPTEKGFEKAVTERFRNQLTPDVKKAMGRGQKYIDYLTNNYERLVDAHPTRTLAKRNNESRNWVEKRPTLEEFLDFYLPKDENGNKRAKDESHRKNALAELVAESIGTKSMNEMLQAQQESTTRDRVNAGFDSVIDALRKMQGERNTLQSNPLAIVPAVLEGAVRATKAAYNAGADLTSALRKGYEKVADQVSWEQFRDYMLGEVRKGEGNFKEQTKTYMEQIQERDAQETQQAAVDIQKQVNGFNHDQFQEDTAISDDDFAAQSKATDKILDQYMPADAEYRKTVNTKDPAQFEAGRQWISNTLTKYFPKEFFQQGMFANAGKSAAQRGFFATSKDDVDALAESAQSDTNSVWNKNGRYIYGNKDLEDVKANWSKIQENNKNNWAAFENMWQTFDQMIKDDINNAPMIAAFLKGAQNSQNHISRTAAPLIAYSQDKGGHPRYEEEHSLPQSAVSRYMMQTILSGGDVKSALENVQKNFFQVALNKNDDHKLKVKGEYNYASTMPDGWKMSDNTWARYFNANVNGNNGGIDPNSIIFFNTGKTVAETYGAGTTAPKTGDVKAAQQAVVAEQVGDRFEQLLDTAIAGVSKLTGPSGALQSNVAAIPAHVLVGGLRATKLAYRGARDLASAIEAGYNSVKDYMSRQEWIDFTKEAVKEVKNVESPAQSYLATASENAIKNEQERRQLLQQVNKLGGEIDQSATTDQILSKINDLTEAAKSENTNQTKQGFDRIMNSRKPGKINRLLNEVFVGSEVEDFKGLMYRLLPGKEGGQFLQDKFLNPYTEALMKINARKLAGRKQMKDALQKFGKERLGLLDLAEIKNAHETGDLSQFDQPTQQLVKDLGSIAGGQFMEMLDGNSDKTLEQQYLKFVNGVQRQEALQPFWDNVEATLLDEDGNIREDIKERMALPGSSVWGNKYKYADALDNILRRMKSGTNRTGRSQHDKASENLLNLVNDASATVMHWNMRSAALQLLSSLNYVRASGLSVFDVKQNAQSMQDIFNSDYLKNRMDGKAWDIVASEIANSDRKGWFSKARKKLLDGGFLPTQWGDKVAIVIGGAPYYTAMLKKHDGNKDLAMRDFIQFTEENQQSADPSKISQIQSGNLGRLLFAFLNTPFQYTRLSKRAIQDMANGRGSMVDNMSKLAYFSVIQSAMFESLRSLVSAADLDAFFEDEEDRDEEETKAAKKIEMIIDGWKGTNLKTMGYLGTGAEVVRNVYNEYERQAKSNRINPEKFAMSALKISPPVSRKAHDLVGIGRSLWKQNRGTGRAKVENIARIGDLVNLPTYRYYQKIDNLMAMAEEDKHQYEDLLRFFGWTDYAFGKNPYSNVVNEAAGVPLKRAWDADDSPFKFLGGIAGKLVGVRKRLSAGTAKPGGANDKFAAAARARGRTSKSMMGGLGGSLFGGGARRRRRAMGQNDSLSAAKNQMAQQALQAQQAPQASQVDFGRLSGVARPGMMGGIAKAVQAAFNKGQAPTGGPGGISQGTPGAPDQPTGATAPMTPEMDMQNAQKEQSTEQLQQLNQSLQQQRQSIDEINQKVGDLNTGLEGQTEETANLRQAAGDAFNQAAESIEQAQGTPGETPLMKLGRGELGQAHNDGTIEVDPNLKGEEREKVIAHEKEHVKQMKEDGLDYDDNNIYWRGKTFARKNGKIKDQNGKWVKEGAEHLPWEKLAYEAEGEVIAKKSPVKNTDRNYRDKAKARRAKLVEKHGDDSYIDPNHMDYKRKQKLHELQVPQNESDIVQGAKQWTADWELDPETMKRWKMGDVGLSEEQLHKQATRQQLTQSRGFEEGEREGDTHWGRYKPYKDELILAEDAPEEVAAHELAHAGYDMERGAWVKDIVGHVPLHTGLGVAEAETEYINNPQETGAYLQQIRNQLGLKPGQEVTREMLDKADDEYNLYLKAVRQNKKDDKLLEALNTVAYEEKKQMPSLDQLYVQQDSALTRKGPGKKKKPKKKVSHAVYAPGYTKHMNWAGDRSLYAKGIGGSEGGQGGVLYSQHRKDPSKKGGTTYTAGIMQNSYGDPLIAGTVGREWDLGKGWKAGVHGGATHGYGKSFKENTKILNERRVAEGKKPLQPDKFTQFVQDTNIAPVVTGSIEKQFGDSGLGAKALINPMYVNAGLTYQFGKRKKKSKKKRK